MNISNADNMSNHELPLSENESPTFFSSLYENESSISQNMHNGIYQQKMQSRGVQGLQAYFNVLHKFVRTAYA